MEQFLATETLIIELLLIVSLVAIAVRRLRVPYTVALVIVGLLITFQQSVEIDLTPELILALFVPPLVFEAAFHIDFNRLRDNLIPILVLAIPGVLLTTLIVGGIVAVGVQRAADDGAGLWRVDLRDRSGGRGGAVSSAGRAAQAWRCWWKVKACSTTARPLSCSV